jgi:hypothetical protein
MARYGAREVNGLPGGVILATDVEQGKFRGLKPRPVDLRRAPPTLPCLLGARLAGTGDKDVD